MIDTLTLIGCTIAATVGAGAWMLWPIKVIRDDYQPSHHQWISDRDQQRFAGMVVAVDQHTNEIVSAASTADKVRADIERFRPERQCHVIAVPGVASEPLRILLDV